MPMPVLRRVVLQPRDRNARIGRQMALTPKRGRLGQWLHYYSPLWVRLSAGRSAVPIGALIGQQADAMVFGGGTRQGPRLRELAITTSSYGQPIPRNFGRMRAAGTIIWSTDLIESKRKEKGRKGQPSTVSYSYSASFCCRAFQHPHHTASGASGPMEASCAVALGDLKVAGQLRFYSGVW